MCGIIGIFGNKEAKKLANQGLDLIEYRGRDARGVYNKDDYAIGHCLYAMIGFVKEPLIRKNSVFAANCEVYNWKELALKYNVKPRNDSDMMHILLDKKGINAINEFQGVYAFSYLNNTTLYLARDIIGELPIWYSTHNGLAFASEKKALEKLGYINIEELNPRQILIYNHKTKIVKFKKRLFLDIKPEIKDTKEKIIQKLIPLLEKAFVERLDKKRKIGLLLSGGIDSSLLALMLKKASANFKCYTTVLDDKNLKEPEDLKYSVELAKELNLNHKIIKIKTSKIPKLLKEIVPLIESTDTTKVGVALTFFSACKQASKDKCYIIVSGLGSEEIFAGYQRHKESNDINKECLSGLLKIYERDLYRDNVIALYNTLENWIPFLNLELVKYAIRIPSKYKIKGEITKLILRETALKMGLPEKYAMRKKRAAQYGSNMNKALKKLTKQAKLKYISEYLRKFYPKHNLKLGALFSSGKDSAYALYVMQQQNYKIECLITIISSNKESYMFHTPNINLAKLQSESLQIPIIEQKTEGKKENELKDLEKALNKAKKRYKIEGIVTGALFSNYQRERIEQICDKIGLKSFSPLWHMNQEVEMRQLINEGFKVIIGSIAAEGLTKEDLGREITNEFIDHLAKIPGINVAGEGGEFESLVIDGPNFTKKLEINDAKKIMENECTCIYQVKNAKLINKSLQ